MSEILPKKNRSVITELNNLIIRYKRKLEKATTNKRKIYCEFMIDKYSTEKEFILENFEIVD